MTDKTEEQVREAERIALELRAWQKQTKRTDKALAAMLGVSPAAIGQWKTGRRSPSGSSLRLIHVLRTIETVAPDLVPFLEPPSDA